ncbi:uncharacterized protein A4U43_C05F13600 [Asparagus officinalis]|uniref:Uncharacterized protein n=1 Tax=Asparagus officinalis TaxID=4686 RepID=A0A5P1ESF7_ASPOF|nr:uncharacterized protein A4U43_C05F13600 [Asparagus officinalis]
MPWYALKSGRNLSPSPRVLIYVNCVMMQLPCLVERKSVRFALNISLIQSDVFLSVLLNGFDSTTKTIACIEKKRKKKKKKKKKKSKDCMSSMRTIHVKFGAEFNP